MARDPVVVYVDHPLAEAAKRMKAADVGAVFVVNADEPIGVVTDRDIMVRGIPGGIELFVLDGSFAEGGAEFARLSWLRLPAGARLQATAGRGGLSQSGERVMDRDDQFDRLVGSEMMRPHVAADDARDLIEIDLRAEFSLAMCMLPDH